MIFRRQVIVSVKAVDIDDQRHGGKFKVAGTSGQIFEKIMKRYPIFSLQIIYYQTAQMHKQNMLLVKFYLNSFQHEISVFSPYGIMLTFTEF